MVIKVTLLGKNLFSSPNLLWPNGEGKRRSEFAEWHVAWLAE